MENTLAVAEAAANKLIAGVVVASTAPVRAATAITTGTFAAATTIAVTGTPAGMGGPAIPVAVAVGCTAGRQQQAIPYWWSRYYDCIGYY